MKPALLLLFMSVAVSTTAQVPKNVIAEFERIHPTAKYVEWKTEWGLLEDLYKVTYTNWYRQVLVFNRDAEIVISESELPPDYIPDKIHEYVKQKYPHAKYVVWDSFNENNERSYFVICNEKQKLFFNNDCDLISEELPSKPKKPNLLTTILSNK